LQRQRAQLDEEIQQLENAVAEVAKDIVDLQHQRWQVSAQAPTATPDHFTLKAMVPALEIPVDKLGEMLKGLGADTAMSGGILQCFDVLRDLAAKQEAKSKAEHEKKEGDPVPGTPGVSRGPDMPDPAKQAEAQSRSVPMDTDDIDTLRDFLREATASEPPAEEQDVREAVKRMAAAAETLAKRRKKQ